MPELPKPGEPRAPAPVPRFLVELPWWPRAFLSNLREVIFPQRLSPFELLSVPAPFWPDVFVTRRPPWFSLLESGAYHLIGLALLIALNRFMVHHPRPAPVAKFDHTQVIYFDPSEYLPPIDTRSKPADAAPAKADPEYARQPIISVPAEADNRTQTIVTPPKVKLKHDVALPNIVAWSDKMPKPQLAIPPAPVTPAAELKRLAPQMPNSVVAPPPDAAHLTRRADQPNLQTAIVAPPPDLQTSRRAATFEAPQPAVVAPPPQFENPPTRQLGEINIGHSDVIAPAPQLPVAEQRAIPGGRSSASAGIAPQVVPPPPSVSGSGGESGSPGRVIALNLHPAVGAPPVVPAGNRRGSFAATPEGHPGATGTPGTSSGSATGTNGHGNGSGNGEGSNRLANTELPSGLYVGSPAASAKTSSIAGDPPVGKATMGTTPSSPVALAAPRGGRVARPMPAESVARLSEPERALFGVRRLYSLTLNLPNLSSAGGSLVVRFAEIKPTPSAPAADLSEPVVTHVVDPGYPMQLIRENVSGTVILSAVIRADGTVGDVRVLRGVDDRLDRLACQAVAAWKFQPAMKNGTPVDVEATFQIPFRPPRLSNF
jgi:TonB family protein